MVQPLASRVKKVRKHPNKFKRFQASRFMRVSDSWRKPRGIDCKVRRKYRGYDFMPRIGYGTNHKARHVLQNGFKKMRVFNVADLDMLLMHNREYCAEVGRLSPFVSSRCAVY